MRIALRRCMTSVVLGAATILAGCGAGTRAMDESGKAATTRAPDTASADVAPVAANDAASSAALREPPPRASSARSMEGYKRDAARHVYFHNGPRLYEGAPPPLLKSVVVLTIKVDANGAPTHVSVMRSNGFRELDRLAVQSVHDAAPLPIPQRVLQKRGITEFVETWLFRSDGRFQIRSLAEAQTSVDAR